MIVTCQECSTSFQLDDARIPASGARVRCSRCKHSFFIQSPTASQSQAIESVVAEAVQGKAGKAPGPSRDLGTPAPTARPSAMRGEPDEEDWQFSEEVRVAGDDDQEEANRGPAGSPDTSSFDLTGDFGRGLDPDTSSGSLLQTPTPATAPETSPAARPRPVPAAAAAAPVAAPKTSAAKAPEPVRDESSFGSIDDFSSLIEDEDVSLELATESAAPAQRAARRTTATSDDLGDPESWDLVGGDDARHAQSTVAALVRPPKRAASKSSAPTLDLFAESELPPAHEESEEHSATHPHWARAGHILGWCVTAASVAVIGGLMLASEWAHQAQVPQRLVLGPFVAETTRSGWLESSRAGFLLVVDGELRNTGPQPIKPIPLQLALLDGAGERLGEPPLRAGQSIPEETLRESGSDVLALQREQAIQDWLATPIAPGEVRRFTAIAPADQLPARARRVLVEPAQAPTP